MSRSLWCALVLLLGSAVDARAQASEPPSGARSHAFAGGAFELWGSGGVAQDPPGPGYIATYFHGSLAPAAGVLIQGSVSVARRVSVGAELTLARALSGEMSEDSRGHFDFEHLSSTYSERNRIVAAVVRAHTGTGALELQPLGGVSIAMRSWSLTDRTGTYSYPPTGTLPVNWPDATARETNLGIVGGADLVFNAARGLGIVAGMRFHYLPGGGSADVSRTMPPQAPYIWQIAGGVRWVNSR
jgi:hypothetical protein